jgi:hypothetical protein
MDTNTNTNATNVTKSPARVRFMRLFVAFTPQSLVALATWADTRSEAETVSLGYFKALSAFAHAARELAKFH